MYFFDFVIIIIFLSFFESLYQYCLIFIMFMQSFLIINFNCSTIVDKFFLISIFFAFLSTLIFTFVLLLGTHLCKWLHFLSLFLMTDICFLLLHFSCMLIICLRLYLCYDHTPTNFSLFATSIENFCQLKLLVQQVFSISHFFQPTN